MRVTLVATVETTKPEESLEKLMDEAREQFSGPGLQALEISGNTVYLVLED